MICRQRSAFNSIQDQPISTSPLPVKPVPFNSIQDQLKTSISISCLVSYVLSILSKINECEKLANGNKRMFSFNSIQDQPGGTFLPLLITTTNFQFYPRSTPSISINERTSRCFLSILSKINSGKPCNLMYSLTPSFQFYPRSTGGF